MSAKVKFGKDLKDLIQNKADVVQIGIWCHSVYVALPSHEDAEFLKLLLHLGSMELGPEFAFTYEELEQIADNLIAGKNVKL